MEKTLHLHIGLTKTGSSAIQSWLSANTASLLADHGMNYADLAPEAKTARITSGNGRHFVSYLYKSKRPADFSDDTFRRCLSDDYFDGAERAVVSSETLGSAPIDRLRDLQQLVNAAGVAVHVVAFVRDIYGHCWSAYQQYVKRHGYAGQFSEFAAAYKNPQVKALQAWAEVFDSVQVLHYESHRHRLIEAFADAIGLGQIERSGDSAKSVNRSLTASELNLLVGINAVAVEEHVDLAHLLSDALIYNKPQADTYYRHDPEIVASLQGRFDEEVHWVNQRFFRQGLLKVDSGFCADAAPKTDGVETDDFLVVARALLRRIKHLQRSSGPNPAQDLAGNPRPELPVVPNEKEILERTPSVGRFGATELDCLQVEIGQPIKALRLSLKQKGPTFLHLRRIKLFAQGQLLELQAHDYGLEQSSVHADDEANGPACLLSGKNIHTKAERSPFWEINFPSPRQIDAIRIYNRRDGWGFRSYPLRVEILTASGTTRAVYQGLSPANLKRAVRAATDMVADKIPRPTSPIPLWRDKLLADVARQIKCGDARLKEVDWSALLQLVKPGPNVTLSEDESTVVAGFLLAQKMHGQETSLFSFSLALNTREQLVRIQGRLNELAQTYQQGVFTITRHGVSRAKLLSAPDRVITHLKAVIGMLQQKGLQPVLAYGTLLGAVRAGEFIAHDDDVDLLYCPPSATGREQAIASSVELKNMFKGTGYRVTAKFPAAMNMIVSDPETGASVDIFPCWHEGDRCFLHMERMRIRDVASDLLWPPSEVMLHGERLPAPASPLAFLMDRYGPSWETSDQFFEWPWQLE